MHRSIVIAIFFFWPVLASSADWQLIVNTKLGELKLDKASVVKEEKYTQAVLVYEFKDLQKLTSAPFPVFNRRQDDVLVDCSNPLLGLRSSRFFEDAKLVHTSPLKMADIKFNSPTPDSMAAAVVKAVCAASLQTKP